MRTRIVARVIICCTSILLLLAGTSAHATITITVAPGDIIGLANAINAYNSGGQQSFDYVINLTQSTYTLTSALPNIDRGFSAETSYNGTLTINGNGATIQRSGGAPAFGIFVATATNLYINNLTIRAGSNNERGVGAGALEVNPGFFCFFDCGPVDTPAYLNQCTFANNTDSSDTGTGAIVVREFNSLTANGCSFISNSGNSGTITNYGYLTVSNCTFSSNTGTGGGAILNQGFSATITNSTFVSNSAVYGGAILDDANKGDSSTTASLSNCTFNGNSALEEGGAIYNDGSDSQPASLAISNCTFSGNTAQTAGPVLENATFNSTCACDATVTMVNSILQSSDDSANEIDNSSGQFTSQGHNLSDKGEGGDSGMAPGGLLNGPGDIRNTDAKLGPLGSNGGPTQTISLLGGSPAINAGDDTKAPTRDQRGYIRNGPSDIGAFAFNGLILKLDGVAVDLVDGNITLSVEVVQGLTYHLQRNFDLSANGWSNSTQTPPLTATGNDTEQLIDFSATHEFSSFFYRVTTP